MTDRSNQSTDPSGRTRREDGGRAKRAYSAPRLTEYGSVAKLTQSGGSTKAEPHGTLRPCL
jgi:hypothetical protein